MWNNSLEKNERDRAWVNWRSLVLYVLVLLIVLSILNRFGRHPDESHSFPPFVVTAAYENREAASFLAPLAQPGDLLSIEIISSDNHFEPIRFENIFFDADYMHTNKETLRARRKLYLTSCVVANCSSSLRIKWSLDGHSFEQSTPLIHYLIPRKYKTHRLFRDGEKEAGDDAIGEDSQAKLALYVQPVFTLSPVVDFQTPLIAQLRSFTPVIHAKNLYGPALYVNNFWVLRKHLQELNATSAKDLYLTVEVAPLSPFKLLLYEQFDRSMKQQDRMFGAEGDTDELKRIFLETNPYFLLLTVTVMLLHIVFEYMAFSNDVKFWRGRKDFKGLSLSGVVINCYFQTVILLYLFDTNGTSWVVLIPSSIGVLTEYWKLLQCVTFVRVSHSHSVAKQDSREDRRGTKQLFRSLSWGDYRLQFRYPYDKKTKWHDETAVRWLVYCATPIFVGYGIYSALYNEFGGWYSYLIYTQAQFIYFFGFAMMTPQIFVNYKLKSVEQLPWRTFMFKALNTVIDDLFSFIITMPWLHRLACFRDDVVFVIILYQRWLYPVDATRNEDSGSNKGANDAPLAEEPQVIDALADGKKAQ